MTDPKIIDGKALSSQLMGEIASEVASLLDQGLPAPHLAAVLVGDDPASQSYVASKEKACKQAGLISSLYKLPGDISMTKLFEVIDFLNTDPEIDGFIVQMPLPPQLDPGKVIERINPSRDVDGFHPVNAGRMMQGIPGFVPATPLGIMTMLERYRIPTEGKHCVVLGRSNIVGTPVSLLMSRKATPGNATVTLCHSKTPDISDLSLRADILIAAIGQPGFVKAKMVKEGAVVIDVGIHRITDSAREKGYYITGDVDFGEVYPKCGMITPVPGGVGLMTIVSLLQNTLKAAQKTYQY
ncbi:MAG TPA: tetrahydrofolate dehydrogenase/cyclohydrolase catalytic domain-containing protein [Bacteroidales bacterium]|nr:tetrahydrofolate dehydrogenase/cyclohydrolase catalytic domain-containing protein [Bacteroidales bacterium]HSA44394.1 tetrahydrofolate dehydrogenase/cyclohydrolase catalytic domain-containing protein [Bacteroidales bacterium]